MKKLALAMWQIWIIVITVLYFLDKISFELAVIICLISISSMILISNLEE